VEVRERILTEAGLLFGKYGIRSMTMDALAEEMGISKRTIYERFKDKDTLLMEVIQYYKEQRTAEAFQIIDESDNAIEAMFRIVKVTINQIAQMNPTFFHDIKKYHTRVYKECSDGTEIRDFSITRKLLETGVNQQVFRRDIHIEIVNRTLHTLFDLFGHDSSIVEAGYHRKEMFEHMIIPYLRGISTEKGAEILEKSKAILE
jgi:AcrR family transcriptional regulator